MRLPAALLPLVLLASAPLGSAPAAATEPARVKALVLDVKSTDLTPGEVETLTSLVTANLARYPQLDVLSGADIKRLVDLEAQKQTAGCDEGSCLSELAGAMGAELVFYGQAGKLGSTIVVTLNVYDAKKGVAAARQPIEARDLGQVPTLMGPAVDNLVRALFDAGAGPGGGGGPAVRGSPSLALGARAREVYDEQEMKICVDESNRLAWWYCDKKARYTENDFVRRYRELTGSRDLDAHERNRNPNGVLVPSLMVGGGSLLFLAGLPVAYYSYVDTTSYPVLSRKDAEGNSLGGLAAVSALAVGAGLGIYGGILMADALEFTDGDVSDHSLKEAKARAAVDRYNEALAEKVHREYGTAQ